MTLSTRLSSGPKFIGLFLTALFSAVSFNSTAAVVTAGAVQDWGSGFQASYTITIEDTDTLNGILSNWQIEVQQPESVDITSAWASGYNGGLDTFSSGSTFTISNENQGFRPDLFAGSQFNITVQGSKPSGLSVEGIGLTVAFTSLDEPPEPVAEVITTAEAISVQDWFNPAFGGGFNVTFECALAATTVTNVDIQLNYLGNGVVQRTSLQGYLGASTQVVSNGNTTVISSSDVPSQTGAVRFQVGVNGAGYSASDFAISCTSGDGIADNEEPDLVDWGTCPCVTEGSPWANFFGSSFPQEPRIATVLQAFQRSTLESGWVIGGDGPAFNGGVTFDGTPVIAVLGVGRNVTGNDDVSCLVADFDADDQVSFPFPNIDESVSALESCQSGLYNLYGLDLP